MRVAVVGMGIAFDVIKVAQSLRLAGISIAHRQFYDWSIPVLSSPPIREYEPVKERKVKAYRPMNKPKKIFKQSMNRGK